MIKASILLKVIYRVNGQKSVALLYTNNEQSKKEIKKTIPFTMPSERAKY